MVSPISRLEEEIWAECVIKVAPADDQVLERWKNDEAAYLKSGFVFHKMPDSLKPLAQQAVERWNQIEAQVLERLQTDEDEFLKYFEEIRINYLRGNDDWRPIVIRIGESVYSAVRNMNWVNLFAWILPNTDPDGTAAYKKAGRMVVAMFYVELLMKHMDYGDENSATALKKIENRWQLVNSCDVSSRKVIRAKSHLLEVHGMSNSNFRRGLDSCEKKSKAGIVVPLEAVKQFFDTPIGISIREARYQETPAFQVCIRNNYINIYWKGCSILKFSPLDPNNTFIIHHKYMNKQGDDSYATLKQTEDKTDLIWSFQKCIVEPATKGDIPAVKVHMDKEKEAIAGYLSVEKPVLLDLEIAFARQLESEEMVDKKHGRVAPRVDMAILKETGDKVELKMIEVKMATEPRLRANPSKEPEIMKQMRLYREFIKDEKSDILKSYQKVANNFLHLGLTDLLDLRNLGDSRALFQKFVNGGNIDPQPYLLIIGDRNDLRARKESENHLDRLRVLFAEENFPPPELWPPTP